MKPILDKQFRANPALELVLFDRLPQEIQQNLQKLRKDADFYGVLVPRHEAGLSPKAVDQDTALLFFTLQQPGLVPEYVRSRLGGNCNQRIAELVLDGVLEIASQPEKFVTGAAALPFVGTDDPLVVGKNRIAQLSIQALQYAQALLLDNSAMLSSRLYYYNTVPISPAWRHKIPDRDATLSFLEIQAGGQNRRLLESSWRNRPSAEAGEGWWVWQRKIPPKSTRRHPAQYAFKLYISPLPEVLPSIFADILEVLSSIPVYTFKIGSSASGLLRPDKIVAYCASFDDLASSASALQARLENCPAQGVPFTASIDPTGLLSWGTDPPTEKHSSTYLERESWRLWVTNQLAVALLEARSSEGDLIPWQFALERLRLQGVEIETWSPKQTIWQNARGM